MPCGGNEVICKQRKGINLPVGKTCSKEKLAHRQNLPIGKTCPWAELVYSKNLPTGKTCL